MSVGTDAADAVPGTRASGGDRPDSDGDEVASEGVEDGRDVGATDRWARWLALAALLAAILPIVVATGRALANDWVAIGDNTLFGLRADDVLTDDHPLLGTWTSASLTLGDHMNNPGPLYFDLLAVPAKLGGDAGLAVGVALLNIAAVVGCAAVARRQGGPRAVVAAMLAAAALGWALGSELLFDPWQPHALLFPFLCFLLLVWGLVHGDLVLLPWAVGLATFVVQTHIGYVLVIPTLGAWAVGAIALRLWRTHRDDPDRWPGERGRALRYTVIAAGVALVGWSQSIYEQLFGPGRGNLGRLAANADKTQAQVGLREAPRYVADILALPPWWGRPSISEAFVVSSKLPSLLSALLGLTVLLALLVGAAVWAWRRGDAAIGSAAATALAVFVISLGAVRTMPVANYGVAPHHLRWLWPVAVFFTFVLASALLGGLARWRGPVGHVAVATVTAATVLLALMGLPAHNAEAGPSADADSIATVRALLPQLDALKGERGVLVDVIGLRFAEPYSVPVMWELERLGVPWYVDDAGMVRQLGEERAWEGDGSLRLFMREGDEARRTPAGAERVAFVEGLPEDDAAELEELQAELRTWIAGGGLRLNDDALAEAQDPDSPNPDAHGASEAELRDPDYLFERGSATSRYARQLVYLVEEDRLDVPDRWEPVLERYAELQKSADRLTVAVFVEPLGEG